MRDTNKPAGLIASNLRLIGGNQIIATVDLEIPAWKLTLRQCRWRNGPGGEHVQVGIGDDIGFTDEAVARRFQAAALAAIRALARQAVAP